MDTRRHQMFPVLEPMEIERVRRFGKVRSYGTGEALSAQCVRCEERELAGARGPQAQRRRSDEGDSHRLANCLMPVLVEHAVLHPL